MSEATLREQLSSALESYEAPEEVTPEVSPEVSPVEVSEPTADRGRDEGGRFAKKDIAPVSLEAPIGAPIDPPETIVEARKPPSSWKKEYWDAYQKLDPQVAEYINQREQQFASGVSTYRDEAVKAREVNEALAPFMPELQRNGVAAGQWIQSMGNAHLSLLHGSPEQKLQMFQKLAQDYGVSLGAIQSGQPDQFMQYVAPLQEQVQQLKGQLTNWQSEQDRTTQQSMLDEIERFKHDAPHFEAVRETMAGLLQAGLAPDLKSAYDKAVRMNDDTWSAEHLRLNQDAEKQRREAESARVNKARANAVSPKGTTPIGTMTGASKKGLRDTLEENVEAFLGGGRV